MTAAVYEFSGQPWAQREAPGLNLSHEEVKDAAGGYVYPARQLRELHARGFVLATIGKNGRVVLPRAHYQAVLSGQFRAPDPDPAQERPAPRANRDRLIKRFAAERKK